MKYFLAGTWVNDETISEIPLGATLLTDAAWATRNSTPYVPTLPEAKERKLAQLEAARKAAETAQVTVQGKLYPATEGFQAKVSRALNYIGRGKPLDLTGAWRDANAVPVAMTPILLGQIEDAITAQGVAAWTKYWTLFDQVQAAPTNAAVEAIVW